MIELEELKDLKALKAFRGIYNLLLGLKMTPYYLNKTVEEFFNDFNNNNEDNKKKILLEAIKLVPLSEEELLDILAMTKDNNGLSIGKNQIKNLELKNIIDRIVKVGLVMSDFDIMLDNEEVKKK